MVADLNNSSTKKSETKKGWLEEGAMTTKDDMCHAGQQ